jgi:hypothetical protein
MESFPEILERMAVFKERMRLLMAYCLAFFQQLAKGAISKPPPWKPT